MRNLSQRIRTASLHIVLVSSGKAEEVEANKGIAGIADLIDNAASSDDAERSKPRPNIFQAAFNKLGFRNSREPVVVGDTPYDAEAARHEGLATIGVLCGGFPEEALRAAGCVAVYGDPRHLLEEFHQSPLALGVAEALT